ncbi:S-layer homology domain-containing protein, partial [Candidatus Peregrinibacteria bacterium]|nr:S-layer homology domain-containing protein [Candidatus Peregrinibacteria bacterium]
ALLSGNGTTQLTLNPSVTLSNSTSYYINWTVNTFKDVSRNHTGALLTTGGWNFTTVAAAASGGGHAGHAATLSRIQQSAGGSGGESGGGYSFIPTLADVGIATEITKAAARPVGSILDVTLRSVVPQELNRKVREVISILNDRLQDNIDRFSQHNDMKTAKGGEIQMGDTERRLSRANRKEEERDFAMHGAPTVGEREGFLVADVLSDTVLYQDVPVNSWFAPFVSTLIEENIAHGYVDEEGKPTGVFGVTSAVTRAESLKMVLIAVGSDLGALPPPRNDSAAGTWASPYVALAEKKNLSMFTPSADVHSSATRGEVVQMILELSGILRAPDAVPPFSDVPADHPNAAAIATAAFYGLVTGDDNTGNFRPDETINRAEVSKIIALLNILVRSN